MSGKLFARLRAGGQKITGDVTVNTIDDIDVSHDHIEAHGFYHELTTPHESTARARGPVHGPITLVKAMDKATPLLMDAWGKGLPIEGDFKFFSPPVVLAHGASEPERLEQVYEIEQARIVAVRLEMLNNRTPEGSTMPVLERVTLTYGILRVINIATNVKWAAGHFQR